MAKFGMLVNKAITNVNWRYYIIKILFICSYIKDSTVNTSLFEFAYLVGE